MKNCPLCKINFKQALLYGVEVDYCDKCLGVWFDQDELRLIKDNKDEELKWVDLDLWRDKTKFKINRGIRICPKCRIPLYEVYYGDSKIVVDVCNLCHGIWLDRGEFKKIIDYLKEKSDYEILNNYAQNLRSEFWEVFMGPETFREELEDFWTVLKLFKYKFLVQYPNLSKFISTIPR